MLSAIIPTLNAGTRLAGAIAALGAAVDEIIVVDGGSADETRDVAAAGGARVLSAPRGRGAQIAAGIGAATGEWLLLLHADTQLSAGWEASIAPVLADRSRAGYFRLVLASTDSRARRLERLVAWRCRVLALPYGDQGLLIHRDLLHAVGGMRDLPLMEDVDLVRRLGARRLIQLRADAITSPERWERDGWNARSARNLFCLCLYLAGVPPRGIAKLYG